MQLTLVGAHPEVIRVVAIPHNTLDFMSGVLPQFQIGVDRFGIATIEEFDGAITASGQQQWCFGRTKLNGLNFFIERGDGRVRQSFVQIPQANCLIDRAAGQDVSVVKTNWNQEI